MNGYRAKDVAAILLWTIFAFLSIGVSAYREDCDRRMQNCTEMVRPFLHDLEYMFPTNIQHVDNMCKMWSGFVDCIRLYVKDCATEDQRARFNDAVGDSIDTVHAICSSEKYQKEYLQSASCFRKVSVDNCGSHYNDMVDEVSNTAANNENICCSYTKFRSCVSEPLLRLCGSRARTIMDHSMAFLIHRCSSNSFSLSYECPKSRSLPSSPASSRSSSSAFPPSSHDNSPTLVESHRVQSASRAHRPSSASSRLLRSEENSASVPMFDRSNFIILTTTTTIVLPMLLYLLNV